MKKTRRRNLSLDDDTYNALARIGQRPHAGSVSHSDGVRVAVQFWIEHNEPEKSNDHKTLQR